MSVKKNQLVKIVLNVDGNDIELSVDNAKELYDTLKVLFEENNPVSIPYPVYPVPSYPTYPYPEPWYKYVISSSSAKFGEDAGYKFC